MNRLRQMSIRTRLILAMGLIVSLFAGFAVYWLSEVRALAELASGLYEHPYRVANAALRVELGILRMHRGMKDFTLAETDAGRNDSLEIVNTEEQEVYRTLEHAYAWTTDEEGKQLVEETREVFAGWKPIRMDVQRLVYKGRTDDAARMTRREGADYVAKLARQLGELNEFAERQADAVIAEVERVQSRIMRQAMFAVLAATLLCVIVGYVLVQSILPDILSLRDTMSSIATTGTLTETQIEGRNEIAEMGRYFNGLIRTLRDQFWLGKGQTGLGVVLISPGTHEGLADRIVNFVARYVDARSAALYTCADASALCTLEASYALVAQDHFRRKYRYGEDIVGQVAVDREPILFRNVPAPPTPDSPNSPEPSGESPLWIYAIPLLYENRLYGVLQISLFETPDSTKQSFLDVAAQSISTAMCAAAQKKRIEELLDATRESKTRIEEQSAMLQQRTAELDRTTQQLQLKNEELEKRGRELEEANRLKTEFMSNVSHELRTPLNSVMALSRVLRSRACKRESQEEVEYLDIIERNGRNLLSLIDDILDLAKIESGRMDLKPKALSLSSSIEAIADSLEPLAEEKGLRLLETIPDDLPEIVTDERSLHHILRNLVGNGLKFTEEGTITVAARRTGDAVVVDVTDTGIGIAPADLPHVFEKFWQADVTLSSTHDGAGLGLTIAYETAQLLGGDLTVSSTPGKGSTFRLSLPIEWHSDISASEKHVEGTPFQKARV